MGRSGAVCEVWLDSVNSLISQKRTAVFLILLPFLIDLPLQNTVFLVKTDPRWPNSPQMRGGACFELGRSIAAGQQKHFSCFFGLLKNLKVWGCALTLSFPCAARLSRFSVAIRDARVCLHGAFSARADTFLCCHETEDGIIKLPFFPSKTSPSPRGCGPLPVPGC